MDVRIVSNKFANSIYTQTLLNGTSMAVKCICRGVSAEVSLCFL